MRRIFLAAAAVGALSIPATVAVVGNAAPAFASSSLTCSKLVGTATGTVTISKCTPLSKADKKLYKAATGSSATLASGGAITWSSSGNTTVLNKPAVSSPGQGGCKKGSTEEDATGAVTGGTATVTHAGDVVSGRVCLSSTGALTLVKGTTFTL